MWGKDREHFLEELLRHDARLTRVDQKTCKDCGAEDPKIRCRDCFTDRLLCESCTVKAHSRLPFHRLERWCNSHYERATLKGLGLQLQLGHCDGEECVNPRKGSDEFIVIHVNGIHEVGVNFCACETAQQHTTQLLRAHLFPATTDSPKTAATFAVLEHFHISTFESKGSMWHFYSALARQTDNTGLVDLKLRYEAFRCMIREFRHIRILKRSGSGHSLVPLSATGAGECALECPACPHPGVNLPADWREAPPKKRWLYTLILAMDANFRLKRRRSSSNAADPGLGTGLAYFVEDDAFRSHVAQYIDQPEMTTCSGFAAVQDAHTRSAKGLSSTGVGALVCARHQLVRRNGACDLQKGEKYANMDYIFWSTMKDDRPHRVVISYDIACQWSVNLWSRVPQIPGPLQVDHDSVELIDMIPNFHNPGHKTECHTTKSFHYLHGVGMTDGEAIERGWAGTNPLANSTKEMGPGARHDTLDDHWGDMNWKKIVGLGTLLQKLKLAVPGRARHEADYSRLSASVPAEDVDSWTILIEAWETDHSNLNPYEVQAESLTQVKVRLAFAQEEAAQLSNGTTFLHEMTPTVVITKGVELEGQHLQIAKLLERRNVLSRRIEAWMECHVVYLPCVTWLRLQAARSVSMPVEAENAKLWLPSAIPVSLRGDGSAAKLEWQLRFAQAQDSLVELRHCLRLRSYLYKYKDKNVRGQRHNTRSNSLISSADRKVKAAADKYREARLALTSLGCAPVGILWEDVIQPLKPEDIRHITQGLHGESEGGRSISWIWFEVGVMQSADPDNDPGLKDTVRVEWAKVRARALRYGEEVDLVQEEMRRTLKWLLVQSEAWIARGTLDTSNGREVSSHVQDGLTAYAHRQAAMYRALGVKFAKMWEGVPALVEREDEPTPPDDDDLPADFDHSPEAANIVAG
ncbi:hypothetical protein BD410DRAFT_734138 [Rickenella mellea]|uniref:CxC2-like cysteine cluster KDZ transposase-associated domain-containing protein n=1 Tax=Rickenella mellea TaxID=50990 RepID=A0A4Y7PHA4_9AGAM|nr:hypothetical protein BD410DRAFT_734138 [Rickenella mellea]